MSDLTNAYLDTLTQELSFDPALAQRMRAEAEDHIREAIACDPMGATIESERRAIARFGAARDIAAQCAIPSLLKQVRHAGASVTLIAVGVLIAMKSRLAWYGAASPIDGDDPVLDDLRAIILSVDRYAFWCALLIAVYGWTHIGFVRASRETSLVLRKRLRQSLTMCSAAAVAVVITVASDTILTALKLIPAGQSAAIFFPSLTIGLEAALAIVLVLRLRITVQRLASSARLFPA